MPELLESLKNTLEPTPEGVCLRVKVVPGASRNRIAGVLADRLKITVAAPPAGGQANRMACDLIAVVFGIPRGNIELLKGHAQPQKSILLIGVTLCRATEVLTRALQHKNKK
jgi:uncharacterized protein (TIGR00251 family)